MAIEVQTTQNVTIDYEPAGVGYRLLAYIIDWIVIAIWILGWIGIFYYTGLFDSGAASEYEGLITLLIIIVVVPILFYDLILETLNKGQSVGKMLFKIRVVNVDGTPPSFGSFLIRWLFRLVDFSLFQGLVGIIMIVATSKSQRLGDYLAGTTVIDLKLNAKNKQLTLSDLDFHEDYKVSYKDILDLLSDRDIQTIRAIVEDEKMQENIYFHKRLADRVKSITGYTYDGPDRVFLKKIISDYHYLALQ